ncbi:MAG: hypothetical protein SFW63_08490 [Alphaproteobacteria bacterium]|nr:hypothetical protein [Alphaproteobacteria bacterium]
MAFTLLFQPEAEKQYLALMQNKSHAKRLKAVRKTLGLLQTNPRHPGLNTHKYHSLHGPRGEDIFEAYAENNTPGAYRVFWFYGPEKRVITILAITPHP